MSACSALEVSLGFSYSFPGDFVTPQSHRVTAPGMGSDLLACLSRRESKKASRSLGVVLVLCTEGSGALQIMKTLGAHDGEGSSGRLGPSGSVLIGADLL